MPLRDLKRDGQGANLANRVSILSAHSPGFVDSDQFLPAHPVAFIFRAIAKLAPSQTVGST
jgi:hypothetical protein